MCLKKFTHRKEGLLCITSNALFVTARKQCTRLMKCCHSFQIVLVVLIIWQTNALAKIANNIFRRQTNGAGVVPSHLFRAMDIL